LDRQKEAITANKKWQI